MKEKTIIYTRPDCPYCRAAKEDFKKREIDYTELDVLYNQENRKQMIKLTGKREVPVIVQGTQFTIGFGGS